MKLDVIKFNIKDFKKRIPNIKNKEISIIAQDYLTNISNLNQTSRIPLLITATLLLSAHREKLADLKYLKESILRPGEDKNKVKVEIWNEVNSEKVNHDGFFSAANKLIINFKNHDIDIETAMNALNLNIVLNAWTIFETTCKDLWRTIVNRYPKKFVSSILDGLEKTNDQMEGLSGKNISMGLLAKYDFNIGNQLGEILVLKYDFTSCEGIYKAFKQLFQRVKIDPIFLKDFYLQELESARHLIVHNAAIIDGKYIRRTRRRGIKVGQQLKYSTIYSNRLLGSSSKAILSLIEIIDKKI